MYGYPVNEAARLCAAADPSGILVSELAASLARRTDVEFGEVREVVVTPSAPATRALPVVALIEDVSFVPLTDTIAFSRHEGHFVGRTRDLDELVARWARAASGEVQVATITGEAGLGKTTLLGELAREVSRGPGVVLYGRCDERVASPYQPFVSANPDVILKLGTKEVLFHTRELGWGSDTALYSSFADFVERFPARLSEHGRLVLKQGRGNGGNGVWKVELIKNESFEIEFDPAVRVQDAQSRDGSNETMSLAHFMGRCDEYFSWSGCLVDQEYQERLADGMLRCYFTHDEVVGFTHQWPKGLLELEPGASSVEGQSSVIEGPDVPAYQSLRVKCETEWVPQMRTILGLERESLPVIWDADFLYGPKNAAGEDTYVLCEINVSAVWPFPPMASDKIATATLARVQAAKASRART